MNDDIRARVDVLKENISNMKTIVTTVEQAGISVEKKPEGMPSRPGYKWSPYQAVAGGPITWIEEESGDNTGTAENPIVFVSGMSVYPNYYYTDGTTRYVCIQAGTPAEICEGEFFTVF